jgi:hypothetical protein
VPLPERLGDRPAVCQNRAVADEKHREAVARGFILRQTMEAIGFEGNKGSARFEQFCEKIGAIALKENGETEFPFPFGSTVGECQRLAGFVDLLVGEAEVFGCRGRKTVPVWNSFCRSSSRRHLPPFLRRAPPRSREGEAA